MSGGVWVCTTDKEGPGVWAVVGSQSHHINSQFLLLFFPPILQLKTNYNPQRILINQPHLKKSVLSMTPQEALVSRTTLS